LIQQSESRIVAGGETTYLQNIRPWLSVLGGVDMRRDAPRDLDLQHIDDQGIFQPETSNNLTLSFVEPSDAVPLERVVGVPLKSYVSLSWTYYFKK
jgi:hypothetical protein